MVITKRKRVALLVDASQPSWLLEGLLRARAGNTGELVHNNTPGLFPRRRCPFCGCRSWFSFLEEDEDKQGEDVFECLRCMATHSRLDAVGVEE